MNKTNIIIVLNKNRQKVLMCQRSKEPYKGKINFVGGKIFPGVYSDRIEHSARKFRADLPPFQSNLSALLSTPFRKSSAYLSGDECNDRFSIPPESLFRAL